MIGALKYNGCLRRAKTALRLAAILCILISADKANAIEDRVYKIEAAFLYNFFNYITWPEFSSPDNLTSPVICIYGSEGLYDSLDYVKRKKEEERNFKIKRLDAGKKPDNCNIVFISSNSEYYPPLSNLLNSPNTLVISDMPGFLDRGGMIELTEDEGRMIISINNTLITKSGFSVSSRLLNIARRVE